MIAYRRKIAKLLVLGALLTVFGLKAHATDARKQGDMTAEVVGTNFSSRLIVLSDYETKKRYRVALAAKITLLGGRKGTLEEVLLGDDVLVKLDGDSGHIRDLSVISQH